MKGAKDTDKIVNLQQPGASANERMGDLLKRVRSTALERIQALVATLFENVDDALFDLAGRAESNAAQTQFFDGMREVRRKRQLVERKFQEQLTSQFNDFAAGELEPARPDVAPGDADGGLSLIDNHALEESLAVSSMVAKAENRLHGHLYTVNQRLSVIRGGSGVENATNPIGPAQLGEAFRIAIGELDLENNVPVKLIIYKLFDRYVMAGLESLYDEVNAGLVRSGVLPQIRPRMAGGRSPRPAGAVAPGHDADSSHPADGDDRAEAHELQQELYSQLRGLLAGRHVHSGHGGSAHASQHDAPTFGPTELLSALSILQAQNLSHQAPSTAESTQQVKQELIEQVRKLAGSGSGNRVSSADEDTIDLVGMLFEFIVADRNLPSRIQALLGRLQIPYLKIAILDKHLFAQKNHPARRLLEALASAGVGWSEEGDREGQLIRHIESAVNTILNDFDEDLTLLDEQLAQFNAFLEQYRRRADLAEQRTAESARGREKLLDARKRAGNEILQRIGEHQLPPVIHRVLTRPWANYLVLTLLRKGDESDEWQRALRFVDEFVWSAQAKLEEDDRKRLRALLPHLEQALRAGLATVAYHENDLQKLMQELRQLYQGLLHGSEPGELITAQELVQAHGNDAVEADSAAQQGAAAHSPVEEIILQPPGSELVEDTPPDAALDDEHLDAARAISVGTWVEFVDAEGNRERAKLSWISPISSKYLFVNQRGLKVCDKTVAMLAAELRSGSTVIMEEVPLFDRALDAIVERLRQTHAAREEMVDASADAEVEGTPESDAATTEQPPT